MMRRLEATAMAMLVVALGFLAARAGADLDLGGLGRGRLVPFATLLAQPLSSANPFAYWVRPGDCIGTPSGNATGTQGLQSAGAAAMPVQGVQTNATGTNTHIYVCTITPPSWIISATTGLAVKDATFFYGVQTNALGTQASVAASGTFNGAVVFSSVTYPAAAASETPSTVTPVRADAGTLGITPAAASANTATTTAGAFYSQLFTPATPIAWSTDMKQLLFTVALQNTATTATVTNSPGALIHFQSQ
jgi:hypothetical protein